MREEVVGSIVKNIFQRDGYFIGKLDSGPVVRGPLLSPRLGLEYRFLGSWEDHPEHGRQFRFSDYQVDLPVGRDAVITYLARYCPWVGTVRALQLYERLGPDTLKIVREEPERAIDLVPGLTRDRIAEIAEVLGRDKEKEMLRLRLLDVFKGTRVPKKLVERIGDLWGPDGPDRILMNPYALIREFKGVGFTIADEIAMRNGYDRRGVFRVWAGLVHAMEERVGAGDVCITGDYLTQMAAADGILGVDLGVTEVGLRSLLESGEDHLVKDRGSLYLPWLLRDERAAAERLAALLRSEPRGGAIEPICDGLAPDQAAALDALKDAPVFLLTGAPGVGKTHMLRRVLETFDARGLRVVLCAPTGKAAKRMSEHCGREASTIHRALGAFVDDDGAFQFGPWVLDEDGRRTEERADLRADVVVVDEASMVDVPLMARLLEVTSLGTRLLIVGDQYQLPSVGPGSVLRSLVECGRVPWRELTEIKRQDPRTLIVRNCTRIKDGLDIQVDPASQDFFFIEVGTPEEILECVVGLVARRLADHFKLDPMTGDIQVITATREKTAISCKSINRALQARLNPGKASKLGELRAGDRVIQTRNERFKGDEGGSDVWVANGDLGRVLAVDEEGRKYQVRFENPPRTLWIKAATANLELAYCLTVHKFQGSEAPVVVVPIHRAVGPMLLQRKWLYTAISRAKKVCVLVGRREDTRRAVQQIEPPRRSMLKERLVEAVEGGAVGGIR